MIEPYEEAIGAEGSVEGEQFQRGWLDPLHLEILPGGFLHPIRFEFGWKGVRNVEEPAIWWQDNAGDWHGSGLFSLRQVQLLREFFTLCEARMKEEQAGESSG